MKKKTRSEDFQDILIVLERVFPKLISNPEVMTGCDISEDEIKNILDTRELSLEVLQHVAGDNFFETYFDELGISEEEAQDISNFLLKTAPYIVDDLKEKFDFIRA